MSIFFRIFFLKLQYLYMFYLCIIRKNYFYSPSHLKMPCHRAIKFWLLKRILPRRPITQPWSSKVEPLPELGPKSNRVLSLKLIMEEISNSIMAVTIKISIIIFNLQPWFQVSSTKMHVYFCTKNKIALWEITLLEITLSEGLLSGIMKPLLSRQTAKVQKVPMTATKNQNWKKLFEFFWQVFYHIATIIAR